MVGARTYKEVRQKADAQTLLSTQINAIAGYLYYSKVESEDLGESSDDENLTGYQEVNSLYSNGNGYVRFVNEDTGISIKQADSREGLDDSGCSTNQTVTSASQPLSLHATLVDDVIYYKDGCYRFTVEVDDEDNSTVESQEVYIRTALMP